MKTTINAVKKKLSNKAHNIQKDKRMSIFPLTDGSKEIFWEMLQYRPMFPEGLSDCKMKMCVSLFVSDNRILWLLEEEMIKII